MKRERDEDAGSTHREMNVLCGAFPEKRTNERYFFKKIRVWGFKGLGFVKNANNC